MGHSEMGLAVAGLSEEEIKRRAKKLSEGDWSDYSPAEQYAFRFAHRQSREPKELTDRDVRGLAGALGRHRAVDVVWYVGWCNYMTRVADAFQFPLETENVFATPKKDEKEKGKKDEGGKDKPKKKDDR
jgi:hypothetical protein